MTQTIPQIPQSVYENMQNPRRARVLLHFHDSNPEELVHIAEEGWARLDGQWVLFLSDLNTHWQSWPARNVVCIDWLEPEIPRDEEE